MSSTSATSPVHGSTKIDPALRALQEAAWEAYSAAARIQQQEPSAANLAACARTHADFERVFCGPTDPDAAPLFARAQRGWCR